MTPAARLQAVVELLAAVEADARPADAIVAEWMRGHRFAGAKDRAAIGDRVFAVLRRRGELAWIAGSDRPLDLALAALARFDGLDVHGTAALLAAGGRYGAAPLDAAERAMLERAGASAAALPEAAAANLPEWLMPDLRAAFGGGLMAEAAALAGRAPLDLRVNRLKATPDQAVALLAADGVATQPGALAPDGLRVVAGGNALRNSRALRDGVVEVQDEGSQVAAVLVDARPGQVVVDLCAGAGGKSLALAAALSGHGIVHAFDGDPARLARLGPRAERAEARAIRIHAGDAAAAGRATLVGAADRVLVDAPCSGSGAWRRRPEEKWRLTPDRLAELGRVQRALLDQGAGLVKPGGRLIYVTCSMLPCENRAAVDEVLARRPGFRLLPVGSLWPALLRGAPPRSGDDDLMLSPARSGTDGFYVAILERTA